ncbi:xylulokinase [Spirochaetia bacterium]|nr:xylulokinase [Spirochaetia bacterium]
MSVILGIDLGTSSIKGLLLDSGAASPGVIAVAARAHELSIRRTGWAEQDPDAWWQLTRELLGQLKEEQPRAFAEIGAIGFSGQMHGLVALDSKNRPLRPAILWLDQRAAGEVKEIADLINENGWAPSIQNRVSMGFALPSLLWLKKFEPSVFAEIAQILLPKDFLRMKMTGSVATDYSDASATGAFSVADHDWAWPLIRSLGLPDALFPRCSPSQEIAGYVTRECAGATGLKEGIPLVFGAGDQMAQSIGNGVVSEGLLIANIGTGGQIAAYSAKDVFDPELRTHTFCHGINRAYTVYGATLCSGMSLHWLKNKVLRQDSYPELDRAASEAPPGSGGLIYLPYLSGERTPHMNSRARGVFFGLQLDQDYRFLIRAVMEGVAFSLKDSICILEGLGIRAGRIIASGGGAKSPLWLQIQADIFEKEIQVSETEEQACLGACILAGLGTGIFKNLEEPCGRFVKFKPLIYTPDDKNSALYRKAYILYKEIYQNTRFLMERFSE